MLAFLIPFPILIAIVLAPTLFAALRDANDANDLKAHGVETTGTVDGLYKQDRRRGGAAYHAVYHFADPAHPNDPKRYISGDDRVGLSFYNTLKTNSSVQVLYDSRDPEHSAVEAELASKPVFDFSLQDIATQLGIPATVFAGLAIFGFLKFLGEKRLLQMGQAVSASIVSEVEVQGRNGRTARVIYAFKDANGQTIQGTRSAIPTEDAKSEKSQAYRASLLDKPTVLYDPNNSSRNMLYPGALASLA